MLTFENPLMGIERINEPMKNLIKNLMNNKVPILFFYFNYYKRNIIEL